MFTASTQASITINRDRGDFFSWFLAIDPPLFLHRYLIIPGVVAVRNQSGPMEIPGSARELVLSDGTSIIEEVLHSDPPRSTHYRIAGFTNLFKYLVKEGNASFTFSELPSGGTRIDWHYTFISHNLITMLISKPVVSIFWKGFMKSALIRVQQLSESGLAAS